ncbi:MAG: RDD family protein [Bacteroidetes bacterium]|nr:RDD family protein [Bacteroidota bacterium]
MQHITVRTSQNVVIRFPVASVGERILGFLIDRLILVLYSAAVYALFLNLKINKIWLGIGLILIPWLLFNLLFEIFMNGQTPGKYLMKIQVIKMNGTRATVGNYIIRWIFSFIDYYILNGAIAVLFIAAGGKGQRLGDVVAGTAVVKLTKEKEIKANEIFITEEANYTPTFEQALQLLPSDIDLMQRVLEAQKMSGNEEPLHVLTEKIKSRLSISTSLTPNTFILTLIKDYNHLTSRG